MGQRGSIESDDDHQMVCVPSTTPQWELILTNPVDKWSKLAGSYGFPDYPYGCVARECDRDSICLKRARASLRKSSNVFEVHRFKQPVKTVSYAQYPTLKAKVMGGYQLSEIVAAMHEDLVLLILYHWDKLQYRAVFVLADLSACVVKAHFESPQSNMSIMECKISSDGLHIAVLFYFRHHSDMPFTYDLYLFAAGCQEPVEIVPLNTEVRPYIAFDPRFSATRVAIVNYTNESEGVKNSLVLYCLRTHKIIAVSHVMLSIIYGGGYFCVNYSRDGRFLILQKISDNMNGLHCYADAYVFETNTLGLLKHYFANLQAFSTLCDTNYSPLFSRCGSRMAIPSEELFENQRSMQVSLYQLPRPLRLQEQCRTVILQTLRSQKAIAKLPLPPRLKDFLRFKPL